MSEAAIKNAALEAGIVIRRADGDFISDSPVNLSRFIRFLARQPYVIPVDKSADRIEALEARVGVLELALRTAARRFSFMASVGWVNGIDPAVAHNECVAALQPEDDK